MKQIFEIMEFAYNLGIRISEITLTKDQAQGIINDKTKLLKTINTNVGEVKIKII